MKDREIALALGYAAAANENTHPDLKTAASKHLANFQRLEKARAQFQKWKTELITATREHDLSLREFQSAMRTHGQPVASDGEMEEFNPESEG